MYANRRNFRVLKDILVEEDDGDVMFHWKWKYGRFAYVQWKIRNITIIYGRIAKLFASFRKSGSRNTMVTSDFSPEVEIHNPSLPVYCVL